MSEKMLKAIQETLNELNNMSDEEFLAEMKKHLPYAHLYAELERRIMAEPITEDELDRSMCEAIKKIGW